jgi:hypothetical protein
MLSSTSLRSSHAYRPDYTRINLPKSLLFILLPLRPIKVGNAVKLATLP